MASPCYYHPSVSSTTSCLPCGMPICADCTQQIAGRAVCGKCAPSFKARMEQQAAAAQASGRQAPYAGYAPQPMGGAPAPPYSTAAAAREPSDMKLMVMGIGLGLVIGIIGAVAIEKILFYAHFGLSLLYVGMGYGIGWGIHRVVGRGGTGMALIAVSVMTVALCISHLVWAQDVLNIVRDAGRADSSATLFDAFPIAMASLGVMHWVCIVFGLLACYRGMEQQQA